MRNQLLLFLLFNILFSITVKAQWAKTNSPSGIDINSLTSKGSNIYGGSNFNGVYVSSNAGSTWTNINTGISNLAIYCFGVNGSNLYAGSYGGGIFLSTNDGTSWSAINTGMTTSKMRSIAFSGSNLFGGTDNGGVFLSTNNGTSWTAVNSGITNTNIQALAVNGSTIFAGSYGGGVFKSTNNGTSWTAVNTGLTNLKVYGMAVSGGNTFVGTDGGGIFMSTNGTSWTAVNTGLSNTFIRCLYTSSGNLFAGLINGGVVFSTNNGTSWTDISTGLSATNVTSLTISGNSIYSTVGSAGGAVWSRALSEVVPTINTTGTLTAYSTIVGTPSAVQSFTVGGTKLVTNLSLTAPAQYEISFSNSTGFGSSLSLTPTSGTVAATTIYVRYNPSVNGTHTGNVTITTTGTVDGNVAVTGTSKNSQSITFGALATKNFGDAAFSLTATASSNLTVSYNSSNTSVATISGSTVNIVGVGTSTITASQSGDANYVAATDVPHDLVVNKGNQSITFSALAAKTFGDASFTLSASSSSGLGVTYSSSNTSVATISGNTVTIVGAGTTTITALQPGNSNYNAASNVPQDLTVNKAAQTISFSALSAKTFGDAPFTVSATSSSNLSVSLFSTNTAVATVSGNTITIIGAGSTDIIATQAGNANFSAASNVTQNLIVNKANQTITFSTLPLKGFGDAPFTISATSSSGLSVSFSSSNISVATVSGNTITILTAGITDITASQAGNGNYNAAPDVKQTLNVNKLDQSITFATIADKIKTDNPFTLSASASSGLGVTYSISQGDSIATVSGNTITLTGKLGIVKVKASQTGSTVYSPATDVERTFEVLPPVTLTIAPITVAPTNNGLNSEIKVNQYPGNAISKVELVYKSITRPTWQRLTVASSASSIIFAGSIPDNISDEVGLEYYYDVEPFTGPTVSSDTVFAYVKYPAPGVTLPNIIFGTTVSDYQIITFPLNLSNNAVSSTFEELGAYDKTKWRLFSYQSGAYVEYNSGFTSLSAGTGYMLIVKNSIVLNSGEGTVLPVKLNKPKVLNLKKGFNMIGNPYGLDVSWTDVKTANGNPADLGKLLIYENGEFKEDDILKKFRGGFVFTENDISIKIPVQRNTSLNGQRTTEKDDKDWVFATNFSIKNKNTSNHLGGIGMHQKASKTKDIYDGLPVPRAGFLGYLDVNFSHPEHFIGKFTKDIVSPEENYVWEFTIESDENEERTTLSWESIFNEKLKGKQLILFHLDEQKTVDMLSSNSYSFQKGSNRFKIYYGNVDYIAQNLIPETIDLKVNYPNPVDDFTTIPFLLSGIEKEYEVEMVVFNIMGQKVTTLLKQNYPSGFHEFNWDGKGENGAKLKSGAYIYQMKVSSPSIQKTFSKKMIIR